MYTLALDAFTRYQNTELPYSKALKAYQRFKDRIPDNWELITTFCKKMDIGYDTLFNPTRKQEIIRYRSLFYSWVSLPHIEVARMFDVHHSSVMHLRNTHKDRLLQDKHYKKLHRRLNC
jgi:hypothetical protein